MTNEDIIAAKKELATKIDGIVSTVPSGPEQKKQARFPVEWGNKEDSIEVTKSAYILADAAVTRALIEKERTHVNRTTCLHANKDLRQLHDILRSAIAPKAKAAKAAAAQASRPAAAQPSAGQRRDRYNVSGVEAFKAAGMDAELLRAEQQGSSLLAGPGTGNPSKKDGKGDEPKIRKAPLNLEPIIIVPQAPSAVITKWNIKELLENGVYRTREEQKKAGYRPEDRVSVIHREESHNGLHSYHYKVVDSAEAMKKDDWQRVVAVFVQGPEWQFKGWDLSSFGGKMVNMFQRVSAFHVVFDKEQPHDNVRKMTVHLLSMSRASRNLDNQVRQNVVHARSHYGTHVPVRTHTNTCTNRCAKTFGTTSRHSTGWRHRSAPRPTASEARAWNSRTSEAKPGNRTCRRARCARAR